MPLIHTSTTVGTSEVTIVPAASENYQFLAIADNAAGTLTERVTLGRIAALARWVVT